MIPPHSTIGMSGFKLNTAVLGILYLEGQKWKNRITNDIFVCSQKSGMQIKSEQIRAELEIIYTSRLITSSVFSVASM